MYTVAAFDFDGTLTTCDTLMGVIRQAVGPVSMIWVLLAVSPSLLAWKLGRISNSAAKQRLFAKVFKGMPLSQFEDICTTYFNNNRHKILRPKAIEAVKQHLDSQHRVAVVTASIDTWVRPFANAIGIDTVLATGIATDANNCLTGQFSTPNCHGAEKVRRIDQEFGDRHQYRLIAYGDSSGDSQMLDYADEKHYKPFRQHA